MKSVLSSFIPCLECKHILNGGTEFQKYLLILTVFLYIGFEVA